MACSLGAPALEKADSPLLTNTDTTTTGTSLEQFAGQRVDIVTMYLMNE